MARTLREDVAPGLEALDNGQQSRTDNCLQAMLIVNHTLTTKHNTILVMACCGMVALIRCCRETSAGEFQPTG